MFFKDDTLRVLFFSSLFHDIGKFWQRGKEEVRYQKHDLLSTAFIKRLYEDELIQFVVDNHHQAKLRESREQGIKRLLAEIVCEADNLASSERLADDTVPEQQALKSIFNAVRLEGKTRPNYNQPLCEYTLGAYRFPQSETISTTEFRAGYAQLWQAFIKEIQSYSFEETHPDTLLSLCKKYWWTIPSASYKNVPDVSLYEHSRLTAALSACLYLQLEAEAGGVERAMPEQVRDREKPRYLLVSGDVTGIQKYIYGIGHKGAAKSLKGRSFWLNQTVDTAARYLLDRCGLTNANLVYASGGKFYLLLPLYLENQLKNE